MRIDESLGGAAESNALSRNSNPDRSCVALTNP
jgi:hypothetical protein